MANSKLIVVEGPQGAGKTTITDFIRNKLPYTNLYRLNGTRDNSPTGKAKSIEMYSDLLDYVERVQNKDINLLFDRTFFSEALFCRIGYKDYSFDDEFDKFLERMAGLDFDIYYITLYLGNEDEFEVRLNRDGKGITKYAKFSKESSIKQQNGYLEMADEVQRKVGDKVKVFKIDTSVGLEKTEEEILNILDGKSES